MIMNDIIKNILDHCISARWWIAMITTITFSILAYNLTLSAEQDMMIIALVIGYYFNKPTAPITPTTPTK